MSIKLNLKKGLDIKIEGATTSTADSASIRKASETAITPDDYPGLTLKLEIKEGDTVAKGQPVMHDKLHESIKITAPATGKVKAVVRGARRKIERVIIEINDVDNRQADTKFTGNPQNADSAKEFLYQSGLWTMLRQRPYDIVPSPETTPRDIFITTFDSAPLSPDYYCIFNKSIEQLTEGVRVLSLLTSGKVYVARRDGSSLPDIKGAEMIDVSGPHPAGNAGVHIANVAPVNKGETVWTLDGMTLLKIGDASINGYVDSDTIVAITGSEIKTPCYVKTIVGADLRSVLSGELADSGHHQRIIAGNVLTGAKESIDGFLRFPFHQVTVIPEGDDVDEFMGWASISPGKMSISRSFPGHFLFKKLFRPDARINGGRRAMIMSGEYDKVVPMDIMTEYLIKAILAHDIDRMEALGIYEIAPEDVALAEYVDTSKLELQKIVREGLDYMRKEID